MTPRCNSKRTEGKSPYFADNIRNLLCLTRRKYCKQRVVAQEQKNERKGERSFLAGVEDEVTPGSGTRRHLELRGTWAKNSERMPLDTHEIP